MPSETESSLETRIRAACSASAFDTATAEVLGAYGAEVYGLLVALHRDPGGADDAFSLFAEKLWRTLPAFEWRCSLRTWVYRLARTAVAGDLPGQHVRAATLAMFRTDRSELEKLRDALSLEDRMLLILRIDRDLSWPQVAQVMSDSSLNDDCALAREAARLRKRYQIVRERLRQIARQRGLI